MLPDHDFAKAKRLSLNIEKAARKLDPTVQTLGIAMYVGALTAALARDQADAEAMLKSFTEAVRLEMMGTLEKLGRA